MSVEVRVPTRENSLVIGIATAKAVIESQWVGIEKIPIRMFPETMNEGYSNFFKTFRDITVVSLSGP